MHTYTVTERGTSRGSGLTWTEASKLGPLTSGPHGERIELMFVRDDGLVLVGVDGDVVIKDENGHLLTSRPFNPACDGAR